MKKLSFKAADFERDDIRRLCDVVMKGGVTSGVVYPLAICKLAKTYVIKNIGGTSVGAIAAAVTAAAEYCRRANASGAGYVELSKLPKFLGQPGALFALFAPDDAARSVFNIAVIPIGNASLFVKALRLIGALLVHYLWIPALAIATFLGAFVLAAWPLQHGALWRCIAAAVLLGTVAAFVGIAIWFVYRAVSVLNGNSFGLCHGYSQKAEAAQRRGFDVTSLSKKEVPPLFNWLDAFIAQTAGKPRDEPLTFGDLWNARAPTWHVAAAGERCIDFRMVTTCLTLGRPFQLPFDPTERFSLSDDPATNLDDDGKPRPSIYFCAEEFEKYFPPAVVAHMKKFGKKTDRATGADYYRFPAAERVPIIVATRLSMSFPVLFCAIPLYALDATGGMQQLWFSDGGLTSNFPVHFFDSPLPRWPTFAIDLLGGEPSGKKREPRSHFARSPKLKNYASGAVFMESELPRGTVSPWNRLGGGDARGNVLAFASAILDAARNWQDVTLGTLPGNASRIVGIRLSADQGGLNLNMPPQAIREMTRLGFKAGRKLVDVFACAPDSPGWRSHRWLRYRAIMGAFTRWAEGYQSGYRPFGEVSEQESYESLIRDLPHDESGVLSATGRLASVPIKRRFYQLEDPPIAVLPTRPVV
jgi:hypothetical protein